ncbi:hypothetical protein BOTBODRAFT_59266 [Botryobasidium botryosum FD-172 SS1]|uniref:DUF6314 domain-containing protein n=1 Tax=Botryobasidium botryosum (strain FD-172 SS1) TaxID=930990 RepID=A0A067MAA7_BOTB1|nr:hypothetical protein BOTBODRAFT_59266 [Botryobasidium botryosum FD-172 SS1]
MSGKSGKTVAIIGGGVSGLCAAKALRDVGLSPRIFEASLHVGGLWGPESTLCRPSMRTNISKYTCTFSDFPWRTEDAAQTPATFPQAHQVGLYLSRYASTFLQPEDISLGCSVQHVSKVDNDRWSLEWSSAVHGQQSEIFDHIIIASGFFSRAFTPNLAGLDTFPGVVMHSSEYRLPDQFKGKRVAVVGDSLSAAELAGDMAPYTKDLVHITPRAFWALPRYFPMRSADPATPFLPNDMVLFRRSPRRVPHEVPIPEDADIKRRNAFFKSILGDQSALAPELSISEADRCFIAISENYAGALRSKSIHIQRGHLKSVEGNSLLLDNGTKVEEIDAIVMATGFRTSLPFLDQSVIDTISFDPNNLLIPAPLYRCVFHPSLPTAAFVGMYRGPYFGVIELQARWVAAVFSGRLPRPSEKAQLEGIELEKQLRDHVPRTQFPHSDYVGLMHDLSSELNIDAPAIPPVDSEIDFITPAQFASADDAGDPSGRREDVLSDVKEGIAASRQGKWVAAAVFRSIQGPWKLSRRLVSSEPTHPSGTFTGTAIFTPTETPNEYDYHEQGELVTDTGLRLTAMRKYIYRFEEDLDRIDIYFNDASGQGFFHSLKFLAPDEEALTFPASMDADPKSGWRAVGDHLCIKDFYAASYKFAFDGANLSEFWIAFEVKGPSKDYVATANYTR